MLREQVCILVVDDVNTMRVQVRELLKSFGFRKITIASNGEEAKKELEMSTYHLILCDWQMVPTSGLDFLRYVRAHPEHAHLAFVMVTAESTKDMVVEAIKAGVDDYVVKPLTAAQIQSKVYGVLLKKQVLA